MEGEQNLLVFLVLKAQGDLMEQVEEVLQNCMHLMEVEPCED